MSVPLFARGLALLAAAALAAPSPAAEPGPFSLQDVDFTADCHANAALLRLFSVFVPRRQTAPETATPSVDEALYNAVSGEATLVMWLDNPASWHGLHLVGVRYQHGIERGPINYTLVFSERPERVRAVWNARGWQLPPPGETRDIPGLERYASIGIHPEEELTAVTCFRD